MYENLLVYETRGRGQGTECTGERLLRIHVILMLRQAQHERPGARSEIQASACMLAPWASPLNRYSLQHSAACAMMSP